MLLGLLALVLLALVRALEPRALVLLALVVLALALPVQVLLASLAALAQAGVGGLVACLFPPIYLPQRRIWGITSRNSSLE